MNKVLHSVKVGLVRRESIAAHSNAYELDSVTSKPPVHDPATHPLSRRISRSAHHDLEVQQRNPINNFETPKNIRLNYWKGPNNSTENHSKISEPSSHPSSFLETENAKAPIQTQGSHPHEIPTNSTCSARQKVFIVTLSLVAAAIVITVPTVLGILLTQSKGSPSATVTTTFATTTTIVSAYWSFDNTANDLYGVYNGQLVSGASYLPVSTSQPYVGYGQPLQLTGSPQSFQVASPFFNLSYTSFTIEAWIYPTATTLDRGIFGQCQCSSCANKCFYWIIRNGRLYIDFTSNDFTSSTTLTSSTWYHVTFVYNYQTQQQILYINGVQDAIKSNAPCYQGENGTIRIGSTQAYSTFNYFNGYIDNVAITTTAKSATDILRDASLMAYYSFDLPNVNNDNGPNGLDGTSAGALTVSGRVNQAMRFLGSSASYFRANGFYQVPWGMLSSKPYSMALWINPSSVSSYYIVQIYYAAISTSWCETILGIYSPGGLTGQLFVRGSTSAPPTLTGPTIAINTWTHVSLTYSLSNGYTLYINGVYYATSGSVSYSSGSSLAYIFLGYPYSCGTSYTLPYYQGSIDEFYVFNRELSATEVTSLANP